MWFVIRLSFSFLYFHYYFFHYIFKQEVALTEGSTIYDDWVQNPVPTYFQVWIFDIQNADEVVKNGDKPFLQERGPYTYRFVIIYFRVKTVVGSTFLMFICEIYVLFVICFLTYTGHVSNTISMSMMFASFNSKTTSATSEAGVC